MASFDLPHENAMLKDENLKLSMELAMYKQKWVQYFGTSNVNVLLPSDGNQEDDRIEVLLKENEYLKNQQKQFILEKKNNELVDSDHKKQYLAAMAYTEQNEAKLKQELCTLKSTNAALNLKVQDLQVQFKKEQKQLKTISSFNSTQLKKEQTKSTDLGKDIQFYHDTLSKMYTTLVHISDETTKHEWNIKKFREYSIEAFTILNTLTAKENNPAKRSKKNPNYKNVQPRYLQQSQYKL